MATLDLLKCFPAGPDGTHKMLPKQELFFKQVLDPKGPKYVGFISGVGGGKTITGCVTMLAQAVLYPSTYLICRQYYPELKDTTYRTFKDICPPDLIVEDRIADMLIRIKGVNNKISTILFRPLEDWDKLRSLNLGGFFIDEASQVSEEAFMLLQGRLRESGGLRKGICISNPNGHDWLYRWFYKQDFFKNEEEKKKYFLIKGTSLENTFLPKDYIDTMLNSWSDIRIQREVMGSFDTFEGAIYDEFRRDVHVIDEFEIPANWTRIIGMDAGYRNPAAGLFAAIDGDGTIYCYDEYYVKETLVKDIVKQHLLPKVGRDKIACAYIDPATKQTRGQTGISEFSTYTEHMPASIPLVLANNQVEAGIDRVKTYFKIDDKTKKPRIYIFKRCINLIEELVQYRWEPLRPNQAGNQNDKETPRKFNDHLCFTGDTLVETDKGPVRIDQIKAGDRVFTSLGYKNVLVAAQTGIKEVYDYGWCRATKDHPVLTVNRGKVKIHDLTVNDTLATLDVCKSSLMGLFLGKLVDTTVLMQRTATTVLRLFTEKFGSFTTALSPKAFIYTTSTTTPTITTFLTSRSLMQKSTWLITNPSRQLGAEVMKLKDTSSRLDLKLRNGMVQRMGGNGIGNTLSALLRKGQNYLKYGFFAKCVKLLTSLRGSLSINPNSAIRIAKQPLFVGEEKVYNLHLEGVSEYFANGVLVSNCDSLRYLVMSRPDNAKNVPRPEGYPTLKTAIQRELESIRKPKESDPFQDY